MTSYPSRWPSEDLDGRTSLPHWQVVDPGTADPELKRLAVRDRQTIHLIPLESILWIGAKAGRLSIHRAAGELVVEGALTALTQALGPVFQQINRNTTVNMAAVREIDRRGRRGEGAVVLHDGLRLPVTRLYAAGIKAWLVGRRVPARSRERGAMP